MQGGHWRTRRLAGVFRGNGGRGRRLCALGVLGHGARGRGKSTEGEHRERGDETSHEGSVSVGGYVHPISVARPSTVLQRGE